MGSPKCLVILLPILCLSSYYDSVAAATKPTPTSAVADPSNCSYDVATEMLQCFLPTLGSHNSSLIQSASRAGTLRVECIGQGQEWGADHFSEEESILRTNHFGYLPSLRRLDLEGCRIRRIPSLAFSGLSGLKEFNVRTYNNAFSAAVIMEVEEDALTGLNDLRKLNFTHNNVWTLPRGTFCGLSSLTVLNMSVNYLQDLSDLGFSSAELNACRIPLRTLDLSLNSLSKLPSKSLGQLRKLEHLNLASNNLNVVEDGALGELTALVTLDLANNRLVALPPDLFSQTKYLQELYLQNNSLSVLAPGLFEGLQHLLVLNLSRNDIGNDWLTPDTFASCLRLVALDLSNNRLSRLEGSVLNGLTSLQILDLSYNRLHAIQGNTFLSQHNLHILRLSNNNIESLHPQSLAGLSVLSSLSLDKNRLANLHKDVLQNCSAGLIDLTLAGNLFTFIPDALRPLGKLKSLDIGDNLIASLTNDSFTGLINLYGLRLAGNRIEKFESSVFAPIPDLHALNMANNRLSHLDQGVFNAITKLRMLRLDENSLEDINGLLSGQTELRWLNVSSNRLQWFDYAFIPKNLEWLDVHDNQIEELQNYYKLGEGFSLRTLDASHNKIKKLDSLSILPSLQYVLLRKNKIAAILPSTFRAKTNLRKVDLTSNRLQQLQLSALSIDLQNNKQGQIPDFYLAENPLICDCEMEWLQKINSMAQHRQHARVADTDQIQCQLNNQHGHSAPVSMMQLKKSDFLCPYQAHCFALCMCCDFFACDCRMQCPEGCSCFHDSTWSANVIQCSLRSHTDIPPLMPMDATAIYLDGNNFTGILESQAFIGRKRVEALFLNNSQIAAISNQTFNGLTELQVLHLEDNLMQRVEGYEFGNLTSLRELYLERNQLVFISENAFVMLGALEVLHLHGNMLTSYPVWQLGTLLPSLTGVTLSGNAWSCQCNFVHKFQELARKNLVTDLKKVQCIADTSDANGGIVRVQLNENVTCSDALAVTFHTHKSSGVLDVIPIAVAIIVVCIVVAVSSIVIFVFRTPLRVWLHSKYGIRVLDACSANSNCRTRDKLYDAFVSYSIKDEDFVQQVLLPDMEQEESSCYRLCLQHRDLPNNSSITDTFPGISQLCSKHLLVVSRAYLETEWTQIKFALQDFKRWKPVIILLEELTTLDLAAAPEFNLLLKAGPVVRWNETGFWNKLRFYLPDARTSPATTYKRNIHTNPVNIALNDSSSTSKYFGAHLQNQPTRGLPNGYKDTQYNSGWSYDGLIHSNNSSTSTGSTLAGGVRATSSPKPSNSSNVQLVTNPLDDERQHMYQTICSGSQHPQEHIYHTLEPQLDGSQQQMAALNGGDYDTLGRLDVMLPNGQMVPATLVRSSGGRIIPFVDVNTRTMPHPQPTPVGKWRDSNRQSRLQSPVSEGQPIQFTFSKGNNVKNGPSSISPQHRRQFM